MGDMHAQHALADRFRGTVGAGVAGHVAGCPFRWQESVRERLLALVQQCKGGTQEKRAVSNLKDM